ncbi:MAG: DNA-binding protein, partial [Candidatus Methanoperedens sp.]|nr:DNA-binding protein [Candidatus Methanoperedens sp.]
MDKFLDREVAWRVFAHEFNRSSLHISEGDERAPNYIITPTGVKCNRLFIVGVVTEVENIGKDNNLWRARIADPTGVFTMYAGQYQPEAAIFLSELNIPAYVAVVGKAR